MHGRHFFSYKCLKKNYTVEHTHLFLFLLFSILSNYTRLALKKKTERTWIKKRKFLLFSPWHSFTCEIYIVLNISKTKLSETSISTVVYIYHFILCSSMIGASRLILYNVNIFLLTVFNAMFFLFDMEYILFFFCPSVFLVFDFEGRFFLKNLINRFYLMSTGWLWWGALFNKRIFLPKLRKLVIKIRKFWYKVRILDIQVRIYQIQSTYFRYTSTYISYIKYVH